MSRALRLRSGMLRAGCVLTLQSADRSLKRGGATSRRLLSGLNRDMRVACGPGSGVSSI